VPGRKFGLKVGVKRLFTEAGGRKAEKSSSSLEHKPCGDRVNYLPLYIYACIFWVLT
jgi:hypothetical protein